MSLHLLPPPLMDGDRPVLASTIEQGVVDGTFGECVACRHSCWTWWSPAPPSGFVSLHRERCPAHLRELWAEALKEGHAEETPQPVVAARGRGAYGRRAATTGPRAADRVTFATRRGIELPDGFTPGPFWRPGYSHLEPWTVLFQAGSGSGCAPFNRNEEAARAYLRHSEALKIVDYVVPLVGAVLLAPDGTRVAQWGEAPVFGVERWAGITRIPEWQRCAGCSTARWPGSWLTVKTGRCRACTEPGETADPRPWPEDPKNPGLATAPEWLGGPKKPKSQASKRSEV